MAWLVGRKYEFIPLPTLILPMIKTKPNFSVMQGNNNNNNIIF